MTTRKYITELVISLQDLDDGGVSLPLLILILDHAQAPREIMAIYHSYLLEDEDIETQGVGFRNITDTMVDPAIAMCMISRQGERYSRPGWDGQSLLRICRCILR